MRVRLTCWLLLVCGLALFPPTSYAQEPEPACPVLVVWQQDDALHLREPGGAARVITREGIVQMFPSPTGERVAFTRWESPELASWGLWVVEADGRGERRIDAPPLVAEIRWLDDDTLYFNTIEAGNLRHELGFTPRNDLYRVDLPDDTVTALEPGGSFSFSPDGSRLAVIRPGIYDEEPGQIYALDPTGAEEPRELLDFSAVSSGSHVPFYPRLHWQDEVTLLVAIPEAGAVYALDAPPVALWQLHIDGSRAPIGDVPASYFGLPRWSSDGAALFYFRREIDDPNALTLYLADGNGGNETRYFATGLDVFIPPAWIPGSRRFVFGHDGALWLGAPGVEPQRWIEAGALLAGPQVVGQYVLFVSRGAQPGQLELRCAPVYDPAGGSVVLATGINQLPFAAVLPAPVD
jgi:hypothetical protein